MVNARRAGTGMGPAPLRGSRVDRVGRRNSVPRPPRPPRWPARGLHQGADLLVDDETQIYRKSGNIRDPSVMKNNGADLTGRH